MSAIETEAPPTNPVSNISKVSSEGMTITHMAKLVTADRMNRLAGKQAELSQSVLKFHKDMSFLRTVTKAINANTVKKEFDCTTNKELQDLLTKSIECGVDLNPKKLKYNEDELKLLLKNFEITWEDLKRACDMDLQKSHELLKLSHISHQMAYSTAKTMDSMIKAPNRNMVSK